MIRIGLCLVLLTGCTSPGSSPSTSAATAAVGFDANALVPDADRVAADPELAKRIREDPHAYFRYINIAFSKQVCELFAERLTTMPTVTLHGDPHLEQYAVTDAGRGLTDFDDASKGPAVLDLVRFGVSLELATQAHGWEEWFERALSEFLRGYEAGLARPDIPVPEPAAAERIRASFDDSREGFLSWASGLILSMPDKDAADLHAALASYTEAIEAELEDLPEGSLAIQESGPIRLGVGSALDEKYLLRVRGPSDDPLDDEFLEAKEIRSLAGVPCVSGGPKADPFRFLSGPVRVPYQAYLGTFSFHGKPFWVHAWIANYKELGLGKTLQSPDELVEIAFESGVQLARAHIEDLGAAPGQGLASEHIEIVRTLTPEIETTVRGMTQATIQAWETFRAGP